MKHVFFEPWVGEAYDKGGIFKKRIMVLGESHYIEEELNDDYRTFTRDVVESYLRFDDTERWRATFLKFERSLIGEETEPEDSQRIWQSLLFYNYLQVAMEGPREAGSSADYDAAVAPFFEVLEKYRPEYVIVWGKRLWNNLPGDNYTAGDAFDVDGYESPWGYYTLADGTKVKALYVYHPSVGYDWTFWYKVITEFLNK